MIKGLTILLVMLLVAYPIIELTRVIISYWQLVSLPFEVIGKIEIILMWVSYLAIIPILAWRLK